MNTAYLLLGSNMGNRKNFLSKALEQIEAAAGQVIARSSHYKTEPWGNTDQQDFLNQALCLQTELSAQELLQVILSIEKYLGRIRTRKWEPRTIDIDILFYNSEVVTSLDLIIPHPSLHERRFVLEPLVEIAPDFIHPVTKKSVKKLLSDCAEKPLVTRI